MRKPRDFDSALRALTDKARTLKENKLHRLGELVVAIGADALDIEILAGGLLAILETGDNAQKESWRKQGAAFFRGKPTSLLAELATVRSALRRATAARHRLEAEHTRHDTRVWAVKRRERTRHLIELGGLVQKSGLVDITNDDRALLYGAFLEIVDALRGENRDQITVLWHRRGSRAFKSSFDS